MIQCSAYLLVVFSLRVRTVFVAGCGRVTNCFFFIISVFSPSLHTAVYQRNLTVRARGRLFVSSFPVFVLLQVVAGVGV